MEDDGKNSPFPDVLNIDECARFTRLSKSTLWKLVRERRIPYIKIEGRYIFFLPVIKDWLKNSTVMPMEINDQNGKAKEMSTKIWNQVKGE